MHGVIKYDYILYKYCHFVSHKYWLWFMDKSLAINSDLSRSFFIVPPVY